MKALNVLSVPSSPKAIFCSLNIKNEDQRTRGYNLYGYEDNTKKITFAFYSYDGNIMDDDTGNKSYPIYYLILL